MNITRFLSATAGAFLCAATATMADGSLGEIEITVESTHGVDRAFAVDLMAGKHPEGKVVNGKRIRFVDLPLATYGIVLKCGNHIVEGIRYPDEVYTGNDLAGDDLRAFRDEVLAQETFFDTKTIWNIHGGGKRAMAFVFNERAKSWYDNPTGLEIHDVVIRRYDVQILRKSGVAWLQDHLFFLWREMIKRNELRPMTHQHEPTLAGFALTADEPKILRTVTF